MSGPSSDANPDLESFREQWRAEVRNRRPAPAAPRSTTNAKAGPSSLAGTAVAGPSSARAANVTGGPKKPPSAPANQVAAQDYGDDEVQPRVFDEPASGSGAGKAAVEERVDQPEEPVSALEHYEKAVERETAGKLGDSLRLYRKAFRVSAPNLPLRTALTTTPRWTTASTKNTRPSTSPSPLPSPPPPPPPARPPPSPPPPRIPPPLPPNPSPI